MTLKHTYDAYGHCAGLHADLVRWLEAPANGGPAKGAP